MILHLTLTYVIRGILTEQQPVASFTLQTRSLKLALWAESALGAIKDMKTPFENEAVRSLFLLPNWALKEEKTSALSTLYEGEQSKRVVLDTAPGTRLCPAVKAPK